jgi:tryptophan synthase alpha chain
VTRIGERFARRKAEGGKTFVAFLTAGDPSLERTVSAARELEAAGADVLELGVPFSDPLADGPVIQRSSQRALGRGVTLKDVLETVKRIRADSQLPLLLFSYFNPLLQYGPERLAREARAAGADGVLVTDLPPEEATDWLTFLRAADLDTIFLAAPTSPDARLQKVAAASRGFVYAISRTGVTGDISRFRNGPESGKALGNLDSSSERHSLSDDAVPLLKRLRALTDVPVALGFGIASPEQAKAAAAVADGVVVGSALVRFLEEEPQGDLAAKVRWLRSGM